MEGVIRIVQISSLAMSVRVPVVILSIAISRHVVVSMERTNSNLKPLLNGLHHSFTDINECDSNNGGCEHNCINSDGSYTCTCDNGYDVVNFTNCSGMSLHSCYIHWDFHNTQTV